MAEQKKGFIYRLTMGKDNLPDFMPSRMPGSRWALFKDVFFNRIGAMAKISLLTLLFFIPLILVVVVFSMMKNAAKTLIPYSGNMGIGYPVVPNADMMGQMQNLQLNIAMLVFCIPAVIIAGIGLAGAFHVMKLLAWEEGESVANNFFIGIKKNIKQFFMISVIAAFMVFAFSISVTTYSAATQESTLMHVLRIIAMVLAVIFFIIFLCMLVFMTTQAVTYELKLWPLIKNSFIFAMALFPTNIFFLLLSLLPVLLLFLLPIPLMFSMLLWIVYGLIGISYTILVWTVYAHWAFDRFVNDRVEGAVKNRGMYVKTPEEERAAEIEALKTRNVVYGSAYVSKRLSNIDEGKSFTPLETNFSRADLQRLSQEKEMMQKELAEEVEVIEHEIEAEIRAYDEEQAALKKKRKKPTAAQTAPTANQPAAKKLAAKPIPVEPAEDADAALTAEEESAPTQKATQNKPTAAAKKSAERSAQPKIPEKRYDRTGTQSKAKIVAGGSKKKGGKR
ncbi:MAG: hypothetical protein LBH24_00625 [Clostridiales bacterium]|jgi:hypothetical protein|nr:hypothetical protein [Clostridiales bacterium]